MRPIAQERLPAAEAIIPTLGNAENLRWFDGLPGERVAIHVPGRLVGGRFSVMETIVAPGTAAPLHTHVEDEFFYVLEGNARFRLGSEVFDVPAGHLVVIPANTPHAWINRGPAMLRMIAMFMPGGVEDMFTRIAGQSPERIAEIAALYGTIVLGPPMQA